MHMLVVGQHRAGRELHQQRRDAVLGVDIERLGLAAREARLLPLHLGRAHDVRVAFHSRSAASSLGVTASIVVLLRASAVDAIIARPRRRRRAPRRRFSRRESPVRSAKT